MSWPHGRWHIYTLRSPDDCVSLRLSVPGAQTLGLFAFFLCNPNTSHCLLPSRCPIHIYWKIKGRNKNTSIFNYFFPNLKKYSFRKYKKIKEIKSTIFLDISTDNNFMSFLSIFYTFCFTNPRVYWVYSTKHYRTIISQKTGMYHSSILFSVTFFFWFNNTI